MKDQATPPGQCLMENKRINLEKISLLHWKVCFKYLFYPGTVCIINKNNRFHVSLRLFSNRSQMTSKCGKNKKNAPSLHLEQTLFNLAHLIQEHVVGQFNQWQPFGLN